MKSIKHRKIGFFDSGIGGLTLLKCAVDLMPNEKYIYFGDNKNAPYGNKTKNEIFNLVDKAFKYFSKKNVKAVVIACNTVTAECVDDLRKKYKFKIIGIEPAIKPAAIKGGKTIVLCTKATAESDKFNKLLFRYKNIVVMPQIHLAELIENNIFNLNNINLDIILKNIKNYDNLVLGCTHYIFIKQQLIKYFKINIYDGNLGTVKNLQRYLISFNLQNNKSGKIYFEGSGRRKNNKVYNYFFKTHKNQIKNY